MYGMAWYIYGSSSDLFFVRDTTGSGLMKVLKLFSLPSIKKVVQILMLLCSTCALTSLQPTV